MNLIDKSSEYLNDAVRSGGIIFVAGATGFVGRALVAELAARGQFVVAHVRPDSGQLATWQARFAAMGVRVAVDCTPWQPQAMTATLQRYQPRAVCCTIGTTRKAAQREAIAGDIYQTVDVALCRLLANATKLAQPAARFVLLSSVGAGPSRNAYLQARCDMEQSVRDAGLHATIVRPSVITGERDERRLGEAVAARFGDGLLGAIGLLAPRLRARYRSISPAVLARHLADAAMVANAADAANVVAPWTVIEAEDLART